MEAKENNKNNKLVITIEEIGKINHFNVGVLKEAMRQAELRISDENDRKERVDKRAYTLLTFLASAITLIFAAMKLEYFQEVYTLGLTVLSLLTALAFVLSALHPKKYASLGSEPCVWLQKEFVESKKDSTDKDMLGYMLTHVLYQMNDTITTSHKSNEIRVNLLGKALNFTVLAIAPLAYSLIRCIVFFPVW